jgi:DNA-directed RNA polymerase sigma subunit (sigma70/sigma32)
MAPPPRREPDEPTAAEKRADEERVRHIVAEASESPRPSSAEHARLLEAAGRGDAAARESLTRIHLDWVVGAAREREGRGLSQGDLFQEGTIGLMLAIERFGPSGAPDFEAFARREVAGQMDRALGDEEKAVRDSELLLQACRDYTEAEVTVRRDLGRPPAAAELAQKLEWSTERTEEIGQMVADARRRHDEEILQYLEPGDIDLDTIVEERQDGDAR